MGRHAGVLAVGMWVLAGCGTAFEDADIETLDQELQVSSGPLSITVYNAAQVIKSGSVDVILTGRANRDLASAHSWVPDDAFGAASVTARDLRVALRGGHEVNTLLSGLPLFVQLGTAEVPAQTYQLRVVAAPVLTHAAGSTALKLKRAVVPVYGQDPQDPLRYRVSITTSLKPNSVVAVLPNGSTVQAKAISTGYAVDLTYAQLESVLGGVMDVRASVQGRVYKRTARLGAELSSLNITTADPRDVWPSVCDAQIRTCLQTGATDVCGSYRQVSTCLTEQEENCSGAAPSSVSLSRVASAALDSAAQAFNQGKKVSSWVNVSARMFSVSPCGASLETVVNAVSDLLQSPPITSGRRVFRPDVVTLPLVSFVYSSGGPALLSTADAVAGDSAFEGWWFSQEIQCHNCTDFEDWLILYYPATQRVVVLSGNHGWDS